MRTRHCVAGILAIAVLALALPASAQPGVTVPTTPPPPPPASPGAAPATGACNACTEPVERQGPFVSLGLDTIPQGMVIGDLQLGWMLAPWIGVFMSVDGLVGDESAARLWGAGLRLASGAAFAELRMLAVGADGDCDDCGGVRLVMFGGGVEVLRGQHVALDLHLHVLTDGRETLPLFGAGLGFHF